MKKKFLMVAMLLVLSLSTLLTACGEVKYKISFMVDGAVHAVVETSGNEEITLPNDPVKTDYDFDGWYWDNGTFNNPFTATSLLNQKLSESMKVYAKFTLKVQNYLVTFVTNGGTAVNSYETNKILTCPQTSKTNYVFGGWYLNEDLSGQAITFPYSVTSAVTLYAKWNEVPDTSVVVYFVDDDNSPLGERLVEKGSTVTAVTSPSKTGYDFLYWEYNGQEFDFDTQINSNITLKAKYQIKTFAVKFYVDGNLYDTKMVDYNNPLTDIPSIPTKSGYNASWSVSSFDSIVNETIVNAVYTAKDFVITFNYDGATSGNTTLTKDVKYDSEIGTLPNPEKDNYEFAGWYNGTTLYTNETIYKVEDNITLTAKWNNVIQDDGKSIVSTTAFTLEGVNYEFVIDAENLTLTLNANIKNAVTTFDLRGKFTVSTGASWRAYSDEGCTTEIGTRTVTLNEGTNTCYILVENNTTYEQNKYTLTLYKNKIIRVNFSNFGEVVDTQNVEEYSVVTAPVVTSGVAGYDFVGWSTADMKNTLYDLSQGVTAQMLNVRNLYACYSNGESVSDGLTYTTNTDKTITITGVANVTGESLVIPTIYHTRKVSAIAQGALEGSTFTSIKVPVIGDNSESNSYLAYMYGGTSYSDYNCVPSTLIKVEVDHIEYPAYSFYNLYNIEEVKINSMSTTNSNEYMFCYCYKLNTLNIPNNITTLGEYFIYSCDIDEFILPNSVTTIELYAISGIKKIKYLGDMGDWCNITFTHEGANPSYHWAFEGIYLLDGEEWKLVTDVIIPNTVIEIKPYAFMDMNFNSMTIPSSVKSIGNRAFVSNDVESEITNVYFDGGVVDWLEIEFDGWMSQPMAVATNFYIKEGNDFTTLTEVTVPNSVEAVGNYQFYRLQTLEKIIIEDGVKGVGEYAFYECEMVTTLEIPTSVETIGGYAFYELNVDIDELVLGAKSIGAYAFRQCKFDSIEFINDITDIGDYAFLYCQPTQLTLPKNIENISQRAFYRMFDSEIFDEEKAVASVYYNGTIEDYLGLAFVSMYATPMYTGLNSLYVKDGEGYSKVVEVTIPNTITWIEDYALYGLCDVTSITLHDSVKKIGAYAFTGTNCTSIEIPTGASNIVNYAFSGLTAEVVFTNNTTKATITGQFIGYLGTKLKLPKCYNGNTNYEKFYLNNNYNTYYYPVQDCTNLVELEVPKLESNVSSVHYTLGTIIKNCPKLEKLTINNATSVPGMFVGNMPALKELVANAGVGLIGCQTLEKLTIPSLGVLATKFGGSSYEDNATVVPASLKHITLLGGEECGISDYALYNCTNIETVTIIGDLESVGNYAFQNTTIKELHLPASVTSVGIGILMGNSVIEKLTLPFIGCGDEDKDSRYAYKKLSYNFNDNSSFYLYNKYVPTTLKNVTILDGEMYDSAFKDCTSIESVTYYADDYREIGQYAFSGCTSLKTVNLISTKISYIGMNAFENCSSLTELTLPEGIQGLSTDVFNGSGIKHLHLPNTIYGSNYSAYTFIGSPIESVSVNADNTQVRVAGNCLIRISGNELIYPFKDYDLVEANVTTIGKHAFADNTTLESIVIPEGVEEIGVGAFSGCTALVHVELPSTLTMVQTSAFNGCTALATVTYNGTEVDFTSKVTVSPYNTALKNATFTYKTEENA